MTIRASLHRAALLLCLLSPGPGALAETPPAGLLISFHVYLPPPIKDYTISVYQDGRVVFDERRDERERHFKPRVRTRKVDPAMLKELQGLLDSEEFKALKPRYDRHMWDVGTYTITLPVGDHTRTIVAANMPFGDAPRPMQDAPGLLERLARDPQAGR